MNTHETYCSLETCKLLKEAGFDWSCRGYYDRQTLRFNFVWDHNGKGASTQCSAPTLDVAQRWLREVKDVYVWCEPRFDIYGKFQCWHYYVEGVEIKDSDIDATEYKTYEEAQEAGIKKCLTLILEKDEIKFS